MCIGKKLNITPRRIIYMGIKNGTVTDVIANDIEYFFLFKSQTKKYIKIISTISFRARDEKFEITKFISLKFSVSDFTLLK